MTDLDESSKADTYVIKKADIEKEKSFREQIINLVRKYDWELENTTLSLSNLNYVILVKTNFRAAAKRPYPEIDQFKNKLASILQKYGLKIKTFASDDKTISNDLKYRRIEIDISN